MRHRRLFYVLIFTLVVCFYALYKHQFDIPLTLQTAAFYQKKAFSWITPVNTTDSVKPYSFRSIELSESLINDGLPSMLHWEGDRGPFVMVSDNFLAIFSHPDTSSTRLGTLKMTDRVRAVYMMAPNPDYPNDIWVLVMNEAGTRNLGWVNRDGIVDQKQFRPLKKWEFGLFSYQKGEYYAICRPDTKTGRVWVDWEAKGKGLHLRGNHTGQFYIFEDIIWLKKDDPTIWVEFFFITIDDQLGLEQRFKNDELWDKIKRNI